jgi:type IV secretory pathway TraG/TraD family ATPase VirD4
MTLPVPYNAGPGWPTPHQKASPVRYDLPLGTAAWHQFEKGAAPTYARGQFLLGRLPSGGAIGVHDNRHVLIDGGTRGGKGVSVLVPNLCLWPGSIVVIDPKGENALVTARRRGGGSTFAKGMGQKVRILDPFNEVQTAQDNFVDMKASFNPLDLISPSNEESIDEAARIAEALVVGESSNDPFWEDSARSLIKAVILHVASSPDFAPARRNLVTVRQLIQAGDRKAAELAKLNAGKASAPSGLALLFAAMKRNTSCNGVVADAGETYTQLEESSPRLLGSIMMVARANTDFLESPGIARCVSSSGFALRELKTDPKGTSLYICIPQRFMGTHYRYLRMMTALIIAEMERVNRLPASGHPVMMVLDEFASLKRMKTIENAAAQIAGFGVKLVFAVQTLAQLKDTYKENWETIVANCGVKLFFANDDHFTRKYVSDLIGECEVVRTGRNYSETNGTSITRTTSVNLGSSSTQSSNTSFSGINNSSFSSGASHGSSSGISISTALGETYSKTEGYSQTVHKRSLATPDEIGRWFGNLQSPSILALLSGMQPLWIKRIQYFGDDMLAGLYDAHPHHPVPLTVVQLNAKREALRREQQSKIEYEIGRRAEEKALLERQRVREQRERQEYRDQKEREAILQREVRRKEWRELICWVVISSIAGIEIAEAIKRYVMPFFH